MGGGEEGAAAGAAAGEAVTAVAVPLQLAFAAAPLPELGGAGIALQGGLGDEGLLSGGFLSSLLLIFFSELGDKTFFIALMLATRQARSLVFAGTFGALAGMTIASVFLGRVLHEVDGLLPESLQDFPLDDILAIVLLVYFGVTTLLDADQFEETAAEEKEEAEAEVLDLGDALGERRDEAMALVLSTFSLVVAAEWGDKSFFATTALAAAFPPMGVIAGATAGHALATATAVAGGSALGRFASAKAVGYVGGSLFLLFAAGTLGDLLSGGGS